MKDIFTSEDSVEFPSIDFFLESSYVCFGVYKRLVKIIQNKVGIKKKICQQISKSYLKKKTLAYPSMVVLANVNDSNINHLLSLLESAVTERARKNILESILTVAITDPPVGITSLLVEMINLRGLRIRRISTVDREDRVKDVANALSSLSKLNGFGIEDSKLTDTEFATLEPSKWAGTMSSMSFRDNRLSDTSVRILIHSGQLANIQKIILSGNNIIDSGMEVLQSVPFLTAIRENGVDLSNTPWYDYMRDLQNVLSREDLPQQNTFDIFKQKMNIYFQSGDHASSLEIDYYDPSKEKLPEECFDFIDLQKSQREHLDEADDNIVITDNKYKSSTCLSKGFLMEEIMKSENLFWNCQDRTPVQNERQTYFALKLANGTFYIPVLDIHLLLSEQESKVFSLHEFGQLNASAGVKTILELNYVSGDHCQDGTTKKIYHLRTVKPLPLRERAPRTPQKVRTPKSEPKIEKRIPRSMITRSMARRNQMY